VPKRIEERISDLETAVLRLHEAIAESRQYQLSTLVDGVIQRFEFTLELFWKTLKHYLNTEGMDAAQTPRTTLRIAFQVGLIRNGQVWMQMIDDRNLSTHTSSESTAIAIYNRIVEEYICEMDDLLKAITEKCR
jgi:nucleotidyltransferase substrate binding protein (TIGR01987 family)